MFTNFFSHLFQLGCGKYITFANLQKKIVDLCSTILGEMYYIIQIGIPPAFRDLFLEQSMYIILFIT